MVVDLQCNWHRGISIVSKQLNHMNCDLGRAGGWVTACCLRLKHQMMLTPDTFWLVTHSFMQVLFDCTSEEPIFIIYVDNGIDPFLM